MARKRDEAAFAARRSEVLRAAEALFVTHGFHGTGMAAICEAAGMSPGTLYRYFPAKADIIKAIVAEERAETAAWFDRLDGATDFREALMAALAEAIDAVADETYGRLALEIAAEGGRDADIAAILAEAESEARARLTAIIADAQRRGDVDATADPAAAARLLLMLIDGATGTGPGTPPLSAKQLRQGLRRLLDGLLGPVGT